MLRKKEKSNNDIIPCVITDNRNLPMMRKVINKYWSVLQINPELREKFQKNPFVAFKRNKNLQEIKGGHTIKIAEVFKRQLENRKEKYEPCNANKPPVCCKQVIGTSTF